MLHKTQYYILARLFDHAQKCQVELGKYLNYLKLKLVTGKTRLLIIEMTLDSISLEHLKKEMHKYYWSCNRKQAPQSFHWFDQLSDTR